MSNIISQKYVSGSSKRRHFSFGANKPPLPEGEVLRFHARFLLKGERMGESLPGCHPDTNSRKGWLPGTVSEGRGSWGTIRVPQVCCAFPCSKLTGPSVWWPTNRVTVLVANWTLYFQTEFKAHLTGRCIKYSQVWHRTNWMQFTLPLKFMPFFVKRPQVLTTSLRGWNGREEIESNYKSSLRLLLSSQLPTIASWKWRNPQLLRKDPLFLFIHLS